MPGKPRAIQALGHGAGLRNRRRGAMAVTVCFDHGKNFDLKSDLGADLAEVPTQGIEINETNGRASPWNSGHELT